jgi:CheY-like chemotaxis protein
VRILVVDDERVIADTLATILTRSGFEAHAAYSGEEAIASATELPPHVLISDVGLKGMNGVEAAIRILNQLPTCRVILFSGQATTRDLLRDSRARGYEFEILTKPVHPRTLLECLPQTSGGTSRTGARLSA